MKMFVKLKESLHEKLRCLTTHIPEADYRETLNKLEALNVNFLRPHEVNTCLESNFTNCKIQKRPQWQWLRKLLKYLLIFNLLVPYLIWKGFIQPKIKELEFTSTFRFAVVLTLVPFYLLLITALLAVIYSPVFGLYYLIASLLLAIITVKL